MRSINPVSTRKGRKSSMYDQMKNASGVASSKAGKGLPRFEKNWYASARSLELLPTPYPYEQRHVDSIGAQAPSNRKGKMTPYLVMIKQVRGLRVPEQVLKSTRVDNLFYRIQLSFFDLYTQKFFGHTWVGRPTKVVNPTAQISLGRQTFVYRSAIHDSQCVGVLEYVLCVVEKGTIVQQYGVGWTTLNLFSQNMNEIIDVADSEVFSQSAAQDDLLQSPSSLRYRGVSLFLWRGSPRSLLYSQAQPSQWQNQVTIAGTKAGPCKVALEIFTFKALTPFYHLFRPNEIIGEHDIVGGFPTHHSHATDTETDSKILERHTVIGFMNGGKITLNPTALNSINMPSFSLRFIRPVVLLPVGFEHRVLQSLNHLREHHWTGLAESSAKGTIVQRSLRMGVHNGRTYLQKPYEVHLRVNQDNTLDDDLVVPMSSRAQGPKSVREMTRLEFSGDTETSAIQCRIDPCVALVFELEYKIEWASTANHHQAATHKMITLGWTLRLFDQTLSDLSLDGKRQFISLQRGPSRTLSNHRVFGHEMVPDKTMDDFSHGLWLNIAIQSSHQRSDIPQARSVAATAHNQQEAQAMQQIVSSPSTSLAPQIIDEPVQQQQQQQPSHLQHQQLPAESMHQRQETSSRSLTQQINTQSNIATMSTMIEMSQGRPSPSKRLNLNLQSAHQSTQSRVIMPSMTPHKNMNDTLLLDETNYEWPSHPVHSRQLFSPSKSLGTQTDDRNSTFLMSGKPRAHTASLYPDENTASMLASKSKGKSLLGFDLDVELTDPFPLNSFCVSFTQFSQHNNYFQRTNTKFIQISFNFFNFPAYMSEIVSLYPNDGGPSNNNSEGERVDLAGSFTDHCIDVRFRADVEPQERRMFVEYLYQKHLEIDIWDAETHLLIGKGSLRLQNFLRQQVPSIEKTVEIDIFPEGIRSGRLADENERSDLSTSSSARDPGDEVEEEGKLTVKVLHMGTGVDRQMQEKLALDHARTIPSASSSMALLRTHPALMYTRSKRYHDPLNIMLNDECSMGRKSKGKLLTEEDPSVLSSLTGLGGLVGLADSSVEIAALPLAGDPAIFHNHRNTVHTSSSSSSKLMRSSSSSPRGKHKKSKSKKKLKPIFRNKITAFASGEEEKYREQKRIRKLNLEKIRQHREMRKQAALESTIKKSVSQYRLIRPHFAELVFFELTFVNPYPKKCRFKIQISDPLFDGRKENQRINSGSAPNAYELETVCDTREWLFLKRQYGLNTPTKTNLFSSPPKAGVVGDENGDSDLSYSASAANTGHHYIVLDASEEVQIPFKYQSFCAGNVLGDQGSSAAAFPTIYGVKVESGFEAVRHRLITINIENLEDQVAAFMKVDVRPRAFPVDRTFRFHSWSDEQMDQIIPLPNEKDQSLAMLTDALHTSGSLAVRGRGSSRGKLDASSTSIMEQEAFQALNSKDNPHAFAVSSQFLPNSSVAVASTTAATNIEIAKNARIVHVRCTSHASIRICEFVNERGERQMKTGPASLSVAAGGELEAGGAVSSHRRALRIKFDAGRFPNVHCYYLALFTDTYASNLHSIYQIFVHAHLRAGGSNFRVTVGQRTSSKLYLPATAHSRQVRMISSAPQHLTFHQSGSFELEPKRVNEVVFDYRTPFGGRHSILVYLIDVKTNELVHSWLLYVDAVYPRINNTLQVNLKLNQGARKYFLWENPFLTPNTYYFDSSHPHVLSLPEEEAHIAPKHRRKIHFHLHPRGVPGRETIFMFITDEGGKTNQCLRFHINWNGSF